MDTHYNIIMLSRDAELQYRLVTTNFDTLFERAWTEKHAKGMPINSHSGPALPGPLAAGFNGVLHLHGRIADTVLGIAETDLVLTSAEFGEAYLRSGWATRYIYDLVRATTVVIIGYAAEDPPMRYLLEVIDADRERFKDLRGVYAFVPTETGQERAQCELWEAKGVIPVPYESPDGRTHSALYETIKRWAEYADNPTQWREKRLRDLVSISPDLASREQLDEIAWILGHGDAAQLLYNVNPAPSWLKTFSDLGVLKDRVTISVGWVVANFSDSAMLDACLLCKEIDSDYCERLSHMLERHGNKLAPLLLQAWRVFLRTRIGARGQGNSLWHYFEGKRRAAQGDIGYDTKQLISGALRPRAHIRKPFLLTSLPTTASPPVSLGDLIVVEYNAEIEQAGLQQEIPSLLSAIPTDHEVEFDLLEALFRLLMDSLDEAWDAGFISAQLDRASLQVPSVAQHPQNQYSGGFYPLTRVIADLWERAGIRDRDRAKKFTTWCMDQKYLLIKRLGLHFLSNAIIHTGAEAGRALVDLPDELFWRSERREGMRLMAERWNDFTAADKSSLEDRLIGGPPDSLYGGRDA